MRRLDQNGDGLISYEECEAYLKSRFEGASKFAGAQERKGKASHNELAKLVGEEGEGG